MTKEPIMTDPSGSPEAPRPPLPPFTRETAVQKVRLAEDAWNTHDPVKVSMAYSPDSRWRNRSEFFSGRPEIVAFLKRKRSEERRVGKECRYRMSAYIDKKKIEDTV